MQLEQRGKLSMKLVSRELYPGRCNAVGLLVDVGLDETKSVLLRLKLCPAR